MPWEDRTPTPSRYLEEAAAQLRKAVEARERQYDRYPGLLAEAREQLARQFADLAAIEMGVIPAALARDILDRLTSRTTD